jgi:hypothetical protein
MAALYCPGLGVGINYGGASDHLPFTDYGYKAIGAIENTAQEIWGGSNPNYHTTHDILANIHLDFYYDIVKAGVAATAYWAEPVYEEYAAPAGWINPGWNWVSIPAIPYEPDAARIFGAENVTNKLFRWNPVDKNLELYPDDFHNVEVGRGYVMFSMVDQSPVYDGLAVTGAFEIGLPNMGWTWLGHPGVGGTLLEDVLIRNDSTMQVRTALEDFAAGDSWANWNLIYWDSYTDTYGLASLLGGDDDQLHEWMGYRIWTNADDLTLIVP